VQSRQGRLKIAQDASPGFPGHFGMEGQAQDYILGHFQPSLAGLISLGMEAQDCVLGYSQPSLRDWFVMSIASAKARDQSRDSFTER
jgi:hypothetical protein